MPTLDKACPPGESYALRKILCTRWPDLGPSRHSQVSARIAREMEHALREFVRMPTVSCAPVHREDCWRGAKFLGTLIESLGVSPGPEPRDIESIGPELALV